MSFLCAFWSRCILVSLLITVCPLLGAQRSAVDGKACTATWHTLAHDTLTDAEVLLRNPSVTRWRGGFAAVGDPLVQWYRDESVSQDGDLRGGISWQTDGALTVLPRWLDGVVMYPRVAATSDGVLHVVYGTRVDRSPRVSATPPDSLWHIAFDGHKWSTPTLLPSAPSGPYWWENISPSALVATGNELDIAIPIKSRDSHTISLLHRDVAGKWTSRQITTGGVLALYVRLARVGGIILLEWSAPDPIVRPDRGSIFVMRSDDSGATWRPPQRLLLAGDGDSFDHALIMDAGGRGYVLWKYQHPSGALAVDSIGAATSADSGLSWTRVKALPVTHPFANLNVTLSEHGPLAMFDEAGVDARRVALLYGLEWMLLPISPSPVAGSMSTIVGVTGSQVILGDATRRVRQRANLPPRPVLVLGSLSVRCQ